jgi:hypothetical protein
MSGLADRSAVQVINGEKVVVIHTLNGNVVLNHESARQADEKKRRTWRALSSFKYPTQDLDHDLRVNFGSHLVFHLHRTFLGTGYTSFTSLIEIDDSVVAGMPVTVINLISQYAGFTGAVREGVKSLHDVSRDRVALQQEENSELLFLQRNWAVSIALLSTPGLVAYDFVHDPEGRTLSIRPNYSSTNPNDYPNKVTRTSEVLSFVASHLNSNIAVVDMEPVLRFYPLSKLMLFIADNHGVNIEDIRIDVTDPEEWDYINPAADQELQKLNERGSRTAS